MEERRTETVSWNGPGQRLGPEKCDISGKNDRNRSQFEEDRRHPLLFFSDFSGSFGLILLFLVLSSLPSRPPLEIGVLFQWFRTVPCSSDEAERGVPLQHDERGHLQGGQFPIGPLSQVRHECSQLPVKRENPCLAQ